MKTKTKYEKTAHTAQAATQHADAVNTPDAHTAAYNAQCAALAALGKCKSVPLYLMREHSETAMWHFHKFHELRDVHACADCGKEFTDGDARDNHFMSPACPKHRPTLWR